MKRVPWPERFWAKVHKTDGCWEWTACRTSEGYGDLWTGTRTERAHRLSWVLANGPIPDGLFVCHHCDNRKCVRPDHLFLGTNSDNMRDMGAKGRQQFQIHPDRVPRGAAASCSVLTEEKVRAIRELNAAGASRSALGRQFGVTKRAIDYIVERQTWAHVA